MYKSALIRSFDKANTTMCIAACSQICTCHVVFMKGDTCNLLNNNVKQLFKIEVANPGDIYIRLNMFKEQLYAFYAGIFYRFFYLKSVSF